MRLVRRALFTGLLLATASSGPAVAAPQSPRPEPPAIDLGVDYIDGRVHKPRVFYVLGRAAIRYDRIRLERSFVERIVRRAARNPF